MKKYIFKLLFIIFINITTIAKANDMNFNYKNSWLYNFNPQLINRIEISKDVKNNILIYKNERQNIDNFSKNCIGVNLIQKNKENLIYKLPNGCNISLVEQVNENGNYKLVMYLCSNKGCEEFDQCYICIEDNYDDCGF